MTTDAPGRAPLAAVRGEPLLITAELPRDVLAWADGLRRAHYPPERNRLQAHVTLFHALPPSARAEICRLLAKVSSASSPPDAGIEGIMDLTGGTAFAVYSAGMVALHAELTERLHGVVQQRDARPLRLHITIQNKVARAEARALQADLEKSFRPRSFHFRGFGLYGWDGSLWRFQQVFPFRG